MNNGLQVGISVNGALAAISRVGDLSMGQPLGHSRRVASLARMLGHAMHGEGEHLRVAEQVALLRWSGCTANAEGFSHLLGDDVAGRRAMLDLTLDAHSMQAVHQATSLAVAHCEVSGEVAKTLELGNAVETGLCRVFESYDGTGRPLGLKHERIPEVAYQVVLAGDLEILSRTHGVETALNWITEQSNQRYPASLAALLVQNAQEWLANLEATPVAITDAVHDKDVSLTLVGDVIDLKLPWLSGFSRQVAQLAAEAARLCGQSEAAINLIAKATLIHGLGRAAIPNHLWNTPGPLAYGAAERTQLASYWTHKACAQINELAAAGEIAAHAYERLDGSGHFRALPADALRPEHRLLATAVAWVALRGDRPWRSAFSQYEAARTLKLDAARGLFDQQACDAVIAAALGEDGRFTKPTSSLLTERERQVLRHISQGASNKEAARILGISPSTVRTHVENIFRKLECSTRAAATLKGLTLGLIS